MLQQEAEDRVWEHPCGAFVRKFCRNTAAGVADLIEQNMFKDSTSNTHRVVRSENG